MGRGKADQPPSPPDVFYLPYRFLVGLRGNLKPEPKTGLFLK